MTNLAKALRLPSILLLLVASLLVPAFGIVAPASAPAPTAPSPSALSAHPPGLGVHSHSYPTPIRHVYTVFLENNELSTVLSQGPFEAYLAQKYAFASQYYGVCHYSVANYLSVTSGKPWQCGTDNYNVYSTENIGDLAQKAGLSWDGFMEDMPTPCDTTAGSPYTSHHNPFVYYSNIVNNTTRCDSHDVSFTAWNGDVVNGTLPAYAFFAPNRTHDAHDTNVSFADAWLKGWLSPYVNDSWFNSTVWFIVYDEGGTNAGYNGMWGGHVYMTAVSPWAKKNSTFTNDSTHYSLLATTEWLLGLGGTGNNDSSATYPAMKGLFNFTTGPPPTTYALSGKVVANSTLAPIAGATVSVGGGASTSTNSAGMYSLELTNGSYSISAQAAGYLSQTASVQVSGRNVSLDFFLRVSTGGNTTYPLTGTVSSAATGAPIAGATLTVGALASTTTNAAGLFAFQLVNGSYTLGVSAAGFQSESAPILVAGTFVTHDFSLAEFTYRVNGTVRSQATGAAIVGASVLQGSTLLATTDGAGQFALQLPNGSYRLTFSAPRYVSNNSTVVVAGQSRSLLVDLATASTGGSSFTLAILVSPSSGSWTVGETISFSLQVGGTSSALVQITWNFGDGGQSYVAQPTHAYATAGSPRVSVTAQDAAGASASANRTMSIVAGNSSGGSASPSILSQLFTPPWGWTALAVMAVLVVEGIVLLRLRGRGKKPPAAPRAAQREPGESAR